MVSKESENNWKGGKQPVFFYDKEALIRTKCFPELCFQKLLQTNRGPKNTFNLKHKYLNDSVRADYCALGEALLSLVLQSFGSQWDSYLLPFSCCPCNVYCKGQPGPLALHRLLCSESPLVEGHHASTHLHHVAQLTDAYIWLLHPTLSPGCLFAFVHRSQPCPFIAGMEQ